MPSKRLTFPTQEFLDRITNEKFRRLIAQMLKKNPKERPSIEEVCSNFDLVPWKKSVARFKVDVEPDRVG